MAIKKYDFTGIIPKGRNGKGVLDEEGEEMSMSTVLVRALDEVDLRKQNPQTGAPIGHESPGDMRKRIALADKIESAEGVLQLESTESELLERVIAAFFAPAPSTMVMRALDEAKEKAAETDAKTAAKADRAAKKASKKSGKKKAAKRGKGRG